MDDHVTYNFLTMAGGYIPQNGCFDGKMMVIIGILGTLLSKPKTIHENRVNSKHTLSSSVSFQL
jgi:hypothetical protein